MESVGPEGQDDLEAADREWKLSAMDPHDRHTWRSGVRSAMREAASYLEGGPLMPLYLHVNKKSDSDDDDDDKEHQVSSK